MLKKIAVLVSGGGTNLQALLDASARGEIPGGRFVRVIASRPDAYALKRAKQAGIPTAVVARGMFDGPEAYDRALAAELDACSADLVVLAGFLSILGDRVLKRYQNRMLNIHPSLIPSFCGKGFYGLRVHRAVLERGVKVTGATVHFVNEIPDGGAIVLQAPVPVLPDDTPEILQRRVMEEAEWKLLPQAVSLFCDGRLEIRDGKVWIREKQREPARSE